jgi:hypothetical protein
VFAISVDFLPILSNNTWMSTETTPIDLMDDIQAVADAVAAGKPVPPEIAERVRERSRRAQAELLKKYGVREIAVNLMRQTREE